MCKILNYLFDVRIFLFILEDKIEIQLRGHPSNNLVNHHYNKCIPNHFQNNSENVEVAFLAFTILRPLSMMAPFIEDFMKKQIGVITGDLSCEWLLIWYLYHLQYWTKLLTNLSNLLICRSKALWENVCVFKDLSMPLCNIC